MNLDKKILFLLILLVLIVFTQSGCALLQIPVMLVKLPFQILGQVFNLVKKLPMPPPWVFF